MCAVVMSPLSMLSFHSFLMEVKLRNDNGEEILYSTYIRKALQLYHVQPTSYSSINDDALPLLEDFDDVGEIYKGLPASDE